MRGLSEQNQTLQDSVDDAQAQLSDQDRQHKFQLNELETVCLSLQKTLEGLQIDLQSARDSFSNVQEKLSQRESDIARIEKENLRLKAEGTDSEAMALLKRGLSDQVSHIRNLERANREQNAELQHLRRAKVNINVVAEQKNSLESKLALMKDIEAQRDNVLMQKQALEDERREWSSLLQTSDLPEEVKSPEDLVKALAKEQIGTANHIDQLGRIKEQLLEREQMIESLETERGNLRGEIDKLRGAANAASGGKVSEAKIRFERRGALMVKEVEYLRAQLQTYDTEEVTMNTENSRFDEHKAQQIAHQQTLIDEYRAELEKAHEELSRNQDVEKQEEQPPWRGVKRQLSPTEGEGENERLSGLMRKNRTLLDSLSRTEQSAVFMNRELEATKSQLQLLQEKSRTRILELRDNPTSQAENLKLSTIATLKAENQALLAQLLHNNNNNNNNNIEVVPLSTLESMKLELQDMQQTAADKEKRMRRLKEIWTAKSSEFREAVASLLGFKLDFLPNGRVRVTSMFHLSPAYRHGEPGASSAGPGSMGNGEENSIIFDGENGTMKISGGPNSMFAMEIKHLIKFWVEERKDIPCFLAAMTLEFYDKTTRSIRV